MRDQPGSGCGPLIWMSGRRTLPVVMNRSLFLLLACGFAFGILSACALQRASQEYTTSRIDEAVANYKAQAAKIKLGDSRDRVLELIEPTQFQLESNEIKAPVAMATQSESGADSMIVVHFFRSARHDYDQPNAQGLPPDDDFTPYIFTDDVLTGIGWPTLTMLQIKKPVQHAPVKVDTCKSFGPLAGCF